METVTQVRTRDNTMLELEFNTGEARVFDARPYLERGVFTRLKDRQYSSRPTSHTTPYAGRATSILRPKPSMTVRSPHDA